MLWSLDIQVSHIIIYNSNTSAFTIPIIINMKNKSIKTITVIDYGAEEIFIYKELVKQHQLLIYVLNRPIIAWNIDNTINKESIITKYTKLNLGLNIIDE